MKPTRKAVRDAATAILRDEATGFNARMAALSTEYGIEEFKIDFNAGSKSFFQGAIEPESEDLEYSQLHPKPIALVVSTAESTSLRKQNSPYFSGEVQLRLDAYIQISKTKNRTTDQVEWDDTETTMDVIEEALLLALQESDNWQPNVIYNHQFASERGPLRLTGDGWSQRLSLMLVCEVHL